MALEQAAVVDAFKKEGLDEGIVEGLSFETDEQMNRWIGRYKDATSFKPESLDKFTPEQLIEMASKRQSKSMQSLVDKLKADAAKKAEEDWNKTHGGGKDTGDTPPDNKDDGKSALEKQLESLSKEIETLKNAQKERESQISVSEKKKAIMDSLKKEGCDNDEVLEFVELKMQVDAGSDVGSLKEKGKELYDEKYKKLFGRSYNPVFGGSGGSGEGKPSKEAEAIIKKNAERVKNLKY